MTTPSAYCPTWALDDPNRSKPWHKEVEESERDMTSPVKTTTVDLPSAQLLKEKGVWAFALPVGSVLVLLMTVFYFGSIVDPIDQLHGLPVVAVDQDSGALTASGRVDLGEQVVGALTKTPAITHRL